MSVTCYRELEVWQLGITLTKSVYELTRTFPKHELYSLCNQMQRAAVSIPCQYRGRPCTFIDQGISLPPFNRPWLACGIGDHVDDLPKNFGIVNLRRLPRSFNCVIV